MSETKGQNMTSSLNNITLLVARILLGGLFVMAGLGKLGDVQGFAGYMASGGLPGVLAWPAILFEIIGGGVLIFGFQTRLAALAFAGFCVVTGLMYHGTDPSGMMKNLGLAGGFLALLSVGAGAFSLDRILQRAP